ncbi:hypothetical protein BDA96_01G349900 [Sorghum bicolor]|uniref:F-box domain-containing protein n=1 Tax=Sorghum bicolor TaxID=4558 RepID=A0A921V0E6_SORBI|nr:uncharacterized protein LOC8063203 [Sorghum bicolor]KAG0550573.1 hypothetical protein BDA96_01G349900 [Sorghum bicolor]|eukprot:XP_002465074.1 uncharacterized protein LOC8063203 [Sorghum bicolor]
MESGEGGGCRLPWELVVEILRRLPYRSLCRFRCVSRSWHDLSYHPDHRNTLPQDLAGLLYTNHAPSPLHCDFAVRFAPAGSSPFPGLGFLPCSARALPLDCCNGLLLCRDGGGSGGCHYVCNPATGKFTVLPKPSSGFQALALAAFEPHGASPRFHVLNFARTEPVQRVFFDSDFEESDGDDDPSDTDGGELLDLCEATNFCVQGLEVFSSVTGKWVQSHACRDSRVRLVEGMGSVFINGFVNLLTHEKKVLAVDPEGQAWRLIPLPASNWFGLVGCLGQSQGFLHYAVHEGCGNTMMQVWFLKDFEEGDWILKRRFEIEVAPQTKILFDYAGNEFWSEIFYVVVFHPERDLVFLPVEGYRLLSYNLISAEVKEICMLEPETRPRFLVYVPSFVDLPNPDVAAAAFLGMC